jgi:F-type H+-transporting ATPase subunit c
MMKRLAILGLGFASFATMATNAFAAATTAEDAEIQKWKIICSAFALAIAASAGAFGQSRSITSALDGTARNPGAGADLRVTMIIGLALIESLVIYTFVICLIIIL